VDRYELDEQRRSTAEVLGTVATGGLAAAGRERCLWAASVSTVRALRSIQHVRAETKLHEQPTAAWLRFALPPEPSSTRGGQG
jgi:hypothetical protein